MFAPEEMKKVDHWVLWKLEQSKSGKPTKIPYQTTGHLASTTNKKTWNNFFNVSDNINANYDGVGFCAGETPCGFILIDLDHCIDSVGMIEQWAVDIINYANSYTEISPSGSGIHIFAGGKLNKKAKKTDKAEIYDYARYFTFTGDVYNCKKEFRELTETEIETVYKMVSLMGPEIVEREMNFSPQGCCLISTDEIIMRASSAANGKKFIALYNGDISLHNNNSSVADMALCSMLAFWCNRDAKTIDTIFRSSKLMREKWDRKTGNTTYGSITISNAIVKCKETYSKKVHKEFCCFWYQEETKKNVFTLKIDNAKLLEFLNNNGYTKFYPATIVGDPKSIFVKIKERLVSLSSKEKFNDAINEFIDAQQSPVIPDTMFSKETLKNTFIKGTNIYLDQNRLQSMKPTDINFYRDDQHSSAIFYSDYWAQIDKDNTINRPYSELDGYLWQNKKLSRLFPDEKYKNEDGEFSKFVIGISGNNASAYDSICSALGYLMHTYKSPSMAKAITLLDTTISDVPCGRTGKSLLFIGLDKIRSVVVLDGKTFENENDRFSYQNVGQDTDIVILDDVKISFNFESIFHLITGDFGIEKKGQQKQILPFEVSPKIAITTNYAIKGSGSSFEARIHEIGLPSIYNKDYTPENQFGRKLFVDWDAAEWCRFDWFMIGCLRRYFNTGLTKYENGNVEKRKTMQNTSPEFVSFFDDFLKTVVVGEAIIKKDLLTQYKTICGDVPRWLNANLFGRWITYYLSSKGYKFETKQKLILDKKEQCLIVLDKGK